MTTVQGSGHVRTGFVELVGRSDARPFGKELEVFNPLKTGEESGEVVRGTSENNLLLPVSRALYILGWYR
jgi:hypothetical protein